MYIIQPKAAALSAYHIWVADLRMRRIGRMVAMTYIGIAKGSPCVVPSLEWIISPSMSNFVEVLYI